MFKLALLSIVIASAENPGFTNWFTSELATADDKLLEVEGSVPSYLNGLFTQSGPGRFEMGNESFGHALDGFSKVMRFRFVKKSGGNPEIRFSTNFLQSRFYKNSLKANRITASMTAAETRPPTRAGFGPMNGLGPNDNNYIKPQRIGETDLLTCDTMFLTVMDKDFSEIKDEIVPMIPGSMLEAKHWDDDITPAGHLCIQGTMAHGIPDGQGGYVVTMGCQTMDLMSQYHILFRMHPSQINKRELIAKIKLSRPPSYMHHNGVTDSSYVIIGTPFYMDLVHVLEGKGLAEGGLVSPPGDTTIFQVVSKSDGSVREFQTEGFLMGHVVNSYDDGDDIVLDITYYTASSGGFFTRFLLDNIMDPVKRDLFEKGKLIRYRLKADGTVERSLTLPKEPEIDVELPVIHPDFEGKPYCVFWGVQFTAKGKEFGSFALVKRNICTGQALTVQHDGLYPSEHRFVPRPGGTGEDDGALVGLVYDGVMDKSFLQILDAKTLLPLAKVDLGMKVPFPVHTTWFEGADPTFGEVSV